MSANDKMTKVRSWSTGDDRYLMQRTLAGNSLLVRMASYSDSWGSLDSWGFDNEDEPLILNWEAETNAQSSTDHDEQEGPSQDNSTSTVDTRSWQTNSQVPQERSNESFGTFSFFSGLGRNGADGTTCFVADCEICNRSYSEGEEDNAAEEGHGEDPEEDPEEAQPQPKRKQGRSFLGIRFRKPNWAKLRARFSSSPSKR